ncbi:MAG: hypothetical protein ACRC4L_01275 [Mycoplasma sp.]
MENEDIKKEENTEEKNSTEEKVETSEGQENTEQSEVENQDSSSTTNEPSSLKEKWAKHKKKAGIGLLALLLLIGGGFGIAAAAGAFKKPSTEDTNKPVPPAPVGKETIIKDKTHDNTLVDFKKTIGYKNPETAIVDFEKHFDVINGWKDKDGEETEEVEYFITFPTSKQQVESKTITLDIKASKSLDKDGEEVKDEILKTKLTFFKAPVTSIEDLTFFGTLDEFKLQVGYEDAETPVTNFENLFKVNDGISNAKYLITNLDAVAEGSSSKLNVIASVTLNEDGDLSYNTEFTPTLTLAKTKEHQLIK